MIVRPGKITSETFQVVPELADLVRAGVVDIEIDAECGCGGKMRRAGRNTWVCDRSHWWNRRQHAYLKVNLETHAKRS